MHFACRKNADTQGDVLRDICNCCSPGANLNSTTVRFYVCFALSVASHRIALKARFIIHARRQLHPPYSAKRHTMSLILSRRDLNFVLYEWLKVEQLTR